MPLSPDFCGCEHTTRAAHVTKSSLSSTVSSTTRDTRNTCHSAACRFISAIVKSNRTPALFKIPNSHPQSHSPTPKLSQKRVYTDQYPKIQRKSDDQPFRSPHKVVSCSSPCQYEQSYTLSAVDPKHASQEHRLREIVLDYVRSNRRLEHLGQRVRGTAGLALSGQNRHGRSGGHRDELMGFCREGEIAGR